MRRLPYGSWPSPLSAARVASGRATPRAPISLEGRWYWLQDEPAEGGRTGIRADDSHGGQPLLTAPASVRGRVNEYGGGAMTVGSGRLWFIDDAARELRSLAPGAVEPVALRPLGEAQLGGLLFDPHRRRLLAVRERPGAHEALTEVIVLPGEAGGAPVATLPALLSGHDFYSSLRLRGDGEALLWLAWNHPNMPWDATELWWARLDEQGRPVQPQRLAGGPGESIFQPEFGADGSIYFVSDRSGWWNLYRWQGERTDALLPRSADFGQPQWQMDMRSYAVLADGRVLASYTEEGLKRLGWLLADGRWRALDLPWTEYGEFAAAGDQAAFIAAAPDRAPQVVIYRQGRFEAVTGSAAAALPLSQPEPLVYASEDWPIPAFYYPPRGQAVGGPRGERPPLIVKCHGGPTGAASSALDLRTQYWTSRGFAVLDVNYRGSTGFGRAFRQALYGRWGLDDVEDAVRGVMHAVAQGLAAPAHTIISGSSAGGYTVLCALCFHDIFHAGASYYGIGDLTRLVQDTHKFESRYLERLVAPWPAGEPAYRARSPLFHVERFDCPVIFLQGAQDRVVPPNQAEQMVAALRAKGVPVDYLLFEGEGHGFRRAETVVQALEAELAFYRRTFGLG